MTLKALDNEKELLGSIAAGDQTSYKIIFNHYWRRIYSAAFTFTKSSDLSEDLAQEIFAQIWVKREVLREVKNFEAFLYVTAKNRIIDTLRKKVFVAGNENYLDAYFEESAPGPGLKLEFKDFEAAIHDAVEKLPLQQQTAFRLSRFHGLSHEEIAEKMGLTKETIKSYIVRALTNLRKMLQKHDTSLLILPAIEFFKKYF